MKPMKLLVGSLALVTLAVVAFSSCDKNDEVLAPQSTSFTDIDDLIFNWALDFWD